MKTKKILAFLLSVILLICFLTGCTQAQKKCGEKIYNSLNIASDICIEMMSTVYNAWYFSIYEAKDYSDSTVLANFSKFINIEEDKIAESFEALFDKPQSEFHLVAGDFNHTVLIVMRVYRIDGKTAEMNGMLNIAKDNLKKLAINYPDFVEYETIKLYYSTTKSYAEFAQDPNCSLEQLKVIMEEYEKEIRTYKAGLEFLFED